MSGFDILERIRDTPSLSELPVVVFTGKDLSPDEDARLRVLARSVVVKGVESPERLLDETALFLHRIVTDLPPEKQKMLDRLHHSDDALVGKKVLVVDDDVRNIFALSSVLERRGMIVLTAGTGREAIAMLESTPDVAIVLMDIMMPEMDGYETMQVIRQNPSFRRLPIVALTAKAMKGDREKCLEAGASEYLAKPGEYRAAAFGASHVVPSVGGAPVCAAGFTSPGSAVELSEARGRTMSGLEKVNILMVDDQPGKLLTYESILCELHENLIKARSGREALSHLLKTDIAVVLMDVSMPELDGFELADMIRQHPRFQKTAIIFISAVHLTDLDQLKAYERGAVDYISVPIVPELLRAKVSVFADLHRKTRQMELLNRELRALSARLIVAQDEERRHIARDLHDSVGQLVAVLSMNNGSALREADKLNLESAGDFAPERAARGTIVERDTHYFSSPSSSSSGRSRSYARHPVVCGRFCGAQSHRGSRGPLA